MNLLKSLGFFFLTAALITSCSDDDTDPMNPMVDPGMNEITGEIWEGADITFTKEEGSDPTTAANQDRITDNVWITRGNDGGQIFNIKQEDDSTKSTSPTDTEWARGTTADVASLSFADFRTTITPKEVVGENLVVHLITDDIYIDIKFSSWSQGKTGGFAYTRSTK